jgi:hypothetical protein
MATHRKLPNSFRFREYPTFSLGLPFRDGHACGDARLNQGNRTMKITYLLAALWLVPSFATQATADMRTNQSSDRSHIGVRPPMESRLQEHGTEGREIIAPQWSAACMTDHGPSECGEHMWSYGGH